MVLRFSTSRVDIHQRAGFPRAVASLHCLQSRYFCRWHPSRPTSVAPRALFDGNGVGDDVKQILSKYAGDGPSTPAKPTRARPEIRDGLGNGTFSLLLLNLGVHVVQSVWHPAWVSALALSHWAPQWWQFATSSFVHANTEHLLSNAFSLLVFGRVVEEEEGAVGLWAAYLLCGIGGALASYFSAPHTRAISLGASAAVFGLFIVGVVVKLFSQRPSIKRLLEAIVLGSFVMKQVLGEATILASGKAATVGGLSVGHVAHLGGALAGVVLMLGLARLPPANEYDR